MEENLTVYILKVHTFSPGQEIPFFCKRDHITIIFSSSAVGFQEEAASNLIQTTDCNNIFFALFLGKCKNGTPQTCYDYHLPNPHKLIINDHLTIQCHITSADEIAQLNNNQQDSKC
jgi:hypothetical protein